MKQDLFIAGHRLENFSSLFLSTKFTLVALNQHLWWSAASKTIQVFFFFFLELDHLTGNVSILHSAGLFQLKVSSTDTQP